MSYNATFPLRKCKLKCHQWNENRGHIFLVTITTFMDFRENVCHKLHSLERVIDIPE